MTALADLSRMSISQDDPVQTIADEATSSKVSIPQTKTFELTPLGSCPGPLPSLPNHPEGKAMGSFKPASINARRAACTHIVMERLYGVHECGICQRPSPMGWVYRCVQDERNSSLGEGYGTDTPIGHMDELINQHPEPERNVNQEPTSRGVGAGLSRSNNDVGEPTAPTQLSAWIEKAVRQGHYTAVQISKMREQRRKAIDAVAAAEKHIQEHPEHSADLQIELIVSSPPSDSVSHPDSPKNGALETSTPMEQSIKPTEKPRMFPRCQFRACQSCRPTFRDRAWVKVEDALALEAPAPLIDFKTDQRPLPSKDAICRIGLRVYQLPLRFARIRKRPACHPFNRSRLSTGSLPYQLPPGLFVTEDVTDQTAEVECMGFRESMKRALRGMLDRKKDPITARLGRRRKSKHGGSESSEFDLDLELFKQLNDERLTEAALVPLPGHDGMDGLADEAGEIEVEEGVAVTEEGIDLGTADIIMSV